MEIRTITFQRAHNYGALCQAYALQKVLNNHGNIQIIDYDDALINRQYNPFILKRSNLKWTLKNFFTLVFFHRKKIARFNNMNAFINEKLQLSNKVSNLSEIEKECKNVDVLITGSDQVWNPEITGELSNIYTLNFGSKKIKRISYAASIGNENNVIKYKEDYLNKLKNIDKISVREESAKNKLQEIFPNKELEVVLDPTLLLTKENWNEELKLLNKENEKYILAYVVKENKEFTKITNYLSEKTGLKIIHFGMTNKGLKKVLRSAYMDGPLEFINLIKNADYIVATSFHATVFSVIFNKKFWIVPHNTTGSRVTDLLNKLNLKNRVVNSLEQFMEKKYDEEINYNEVNKILEVERKKSLDWLNNSIKKQ